MEDMLFSILIIKFAFVKYFTYITIKYKRKNKMKIKISKKNNVYPFIIFFLLRELQKNQSWKFEGKYNKIKLVNIGTLYLFRDSV